MSRKKYDFNLIYRNKVISSKARVFFDDPLAQLASQVDGMNINLFYEFLASSDRVALMQAFTRIKSKSLRHAIATLISDLKN